MVRPCGLPLTFRCPVFSSFFFRFLPTLRPFSSLRQSSLLGLLLSLGFGHFIFEVLRSSHWRPCVALASAPVACSDTELTQHTKSRRHRSAGAKRFSHSAGSLHFLFRCAVTTMRAVRATGNANAIATNSLPVLFSRPWCK